MVNEYLVFTLSVFILVWFLYYKYREKTKFEKIVLIKNKYTTLKNGDQNFFLVDQDGSRYVINTSVFSSKNKNQNIFDMVIEGNKYSIKGYGDIKILGINNNFCQKITDYFSLNSTAYKVDLIK